MNDLPIACRLPEAELKQRRAELIERLFSRVLETIPLENGYAFRFRGDGDLLTALFHFIEIERRCCPFLEFRLTVERGQGSIQLDLTGPPGSREFLESAFELAPGGAP